MRIKATVARTIGASLVMKENRNRKKHMEMLRGAIDILVLRGTCGFADVVPKELP